MNQNSDNPLLVDTGKGFTILYKGTYSYSTRDPQKRPVTIAAQTPLEPQTLVFVPCFGLGYGLQELCRRLPEKCHILCVEYDEKLMAAAGTHVPESLYEEKNLTILRTDDVLAPQQLFRTIPAGTFRRVISLPLSGGFRLYEDFYNKTELLLREKIQNYWKNRITLIHMGKLYSRNLIDNLVQYPDSADMSGITIDTPILVAGAGPSLETTIDLIHEIRSEIALIAVDTALPTLCSSGLYPDYIFALEGQFVNILDFITEIPVHTSLIGDVASTPQVLRLFSGSERFLFSSEFHPLQIFTRMKSCGLLPHSIPPLGSVGVSAVYCALQMTGHPVCITGLDFSYPFHASYAKGAPLRTAMLTGSVRTEPVGQLEYSLFMARPRLTVQDKSGNPLITDLVLSSYADNLKTLAADTGRIIEISPFGLDIGGHKCHEPGTIRNAFASIPRATHTTNTVLRKSITKEELINFIQGEQRLIKEGIECIEAIIDSGNALSGMVSEPANDVFRKTDYVWYHLPHTEQFPRYSRAFLDQTILYYRYFEKRYNRAIISLSG